MEKIKHRGVWWLPENPDNEVSGLIEFDPQDGGKLELIGSFDEYGASRSREEDIIHGVNTDGEFITLSECYIIQPGISVSDATVHNQNCQFRKLFVGEHLNKGEIEFDKLDFTIQHLEQWSKLSAFVRLGNGGMGTQLRRVDPIKAELAHADVTIDVTSTHQIKNYDSSKYSQTTSLSVTPDTALSFKKYTSNYIRHLQNFFSLGLGEPVLAREITGHIGEGDNTRKIDITMQHAHYTAPSQKTHPNRINFTLHDIEFESALQNWFESAQTAETLHDRYFNTMRRDGMAIENKFLSFVIGLETLHRRENPDLTLMSNSIYQKAIDQISNQMPNIAAKNRIVNLLESGMGNEQSLRERLDDVTSDYKPILADLMDIEKTIRMARDFRHNIAHGLGSDFDFNELVNVTNRLRVVVLIYFFCQIGVDDDQIKKKLRRKYSHYL